jgi:hypothetical protein
MKKQMGATNVIISEIERSHKCVIQTNTQPEKTDGKTKGAGGALSMNLPYDSMSFVNDKEVKLVSGHSITIVVGDLTQQKVCIGKLVIQRLVHVYALLFEVARSCDS